MNLDDDAAARLIKLLGMLGSAYDGERAAAGRKADEFIRSRGLTWADVIRPAARDHRASNTPHGGDRIGWRAQREFCLRYRDRLRSKERAFLDNIGTWRGSLTDPQQKWLDGIHLRLRRETAA